MKKIAILGASAALAALPMVGTFAATGTTVTDTVEVTIGSGCTIESTNASNTYSDTMTNGQMKDDFGSTTMTINCNDAGGWHVTAVGSSSQTAADKNKMVPSGSGTAIPTGTETSGSVSQWAMKVEGTNATGFTTFSEVPTSATDVASSTASVSGATLTTTYRVFISATQQADTYTGQVTYTLLHPAA